MEVSYEDMVIRERFEKLRRLMKQDYRDVFKARCMAMKEVCESMVSLLEFEEDRHEQWPTLHALIECATTFVNTDISTFQLREDEARERKRGEYEL